jgi:hypothetical protein
MSSHPRAQRPLESDTCFADSGAGHLIPRRRWQHPSTPPPVRAMPVFPPVFAGLVSGCWQTTCCNPRLHRSLAIVQAHPCIFSILRFVPRWEQIARPRGVRGWQSWTRRGAAPMTAGMTVSITTKKPQYGRTMAQQSHNGARPEASRPVPNSARAPLTIGAR